MTLKQNYRSPHKLKENTYLLGWLLWFVAALFYAYEFFHRVAPSLLTAQLREFYDLNDKQLGNLGAMYLYAYALFQIPAGILIDRHGPKLWLVVASLIVTVGSFCFTYSDDYLIACLSRFLIGAGSAFAFVGCLKIGAQWLPSSSFPLVVGLTNFLGTLGALSGGAPFAHLINYSGWQYALLQTSLLGVAITLCLILFLKPSPKFQEDTTPEKGAWLKGLKLVLSNRIIWPLTFYGSLLVVPIAALPEMWGPEYLNITYDLPKTKAASLTHTIFVGTALGGPIIGFIATQTQNYFKVMLPATLGALILLSLFLYIPHKSFGYVYPILFFYGLLTANMLLCFSYIKQIVPSWAQGTSIAFMNMVIMLFGGLAQYGIGWLLDRFRSQHEGIYWISDYHKALSLLPIGLLIAFLIAFFLRKRIKTVSEMNANITRG